MSRWEDPTVLPPWTRAEVIAVAREWAQPIDLTVVPSVVDAFIGHEMEGTFRQQSNLALSLLREHWRNNDSNP